MHYLVKGGKKFVEQIYENYRYRNGSHERNMEL